MCWVTYKQLMPIVAEEDIPCYKSLEYRNNTWLSSIVGYEYKIEKEQPTIALNPYSVLTAYGVWRITRGYHAWIDNRPVANSVFVIPKGAVYYQNEFNEVVASSIILKSVVAVQTKLEFT